MMGYRTPNIDRIADGRRDVHRSLRAAILHGGTRGLHHRPICFRTGLLKVGLPGAKEGLSEKDPTIAELLKPQGYVTGQFGKNHLGDRNEFLPTVHGFDEFFGNLYHLNAEEEPENPDYPKDPQFLAKFGPRGVLKCKASDTRRSDRGSALRTSGQADDRGHRPAHTESAWKPWTRNSSALAKDFIDRQRQGRTSRSSAGSTRPACTSTRISRPESKGKTGLGLVADGMTEFDGMVGQLLKKLDDLGIADNTIVVWTTDNGAEVFSWPDGGTTPFKGEKNTNWEGGYRVPGVMRWPGVIKPGTEINDIVSHEDFVADAGGGGRRTGHEGKLLTGYEAAGKTFKVHLDGYDQRDAAGRHRAGRAQGVFLLD